MRVPFRHEKAASEDRAAVVAVWGMGGGSVFVGPHEGEDARGLARIGGVVRSEFESEVVVIDLEEVALALEVDGAKVVVLKRIIIFFEEIEPAHEPDQAAQFAGREGLHARRDDDLAASQSSAKGVVQHSQGCDASGERGVGVRHDGSLQAVGGARKAATEMQTAACA